MIAHLLACCSFATLGSFVQGNLETIWVPFAYCIPQNRFLLLLLLMLVVVMEMLMVMVVGSAGLRDWNFASRLLWCSVLPFCYFSILFLFCYCTAANNTTCPHFDAHFHANGLKRFSFSFFFFFFSVCRLFAWWVGYYWLPFKLWLDLPHKRYLLCRLPSSCSVALPVADNGNQLSWANSIGSCHREMKCPLLCKCDVCLSSRCAMTLSDSDSAADADCLTTLQVHFFIGHASDCCSFALVS